MMRKWRWLVMFLIVAGLVVEILYDPLAGVFNEMRILQYRLELPLAKARWQNAGLMDYHVDVRGAIPLNCIVAARLVTRHGKLVELQRLALKRSLKPEVLSGPMETERPGCKLVDLTVPKVLDDLTELLQQIDPTKTEVEISFDPQFGYVKHYDVGIFRPKGLFNTGVGDCCSRFDFENFEVLR